MNQEIETVDEDLTAEELATKYGDPGDKATEESKANEESPDTDTDTAAEETTDAPDTDTDTADESTEEEVDSITRTFRDTGLDKTYVDPEAALRSHRENMEEINRLRREQTDRGRQLAPDPTPSKQPEFNAEVWREKFDSDPEGALREAVKVFGAEQVQTLQQEVTTLRTENMVSKVDALLAKNAGLAERQTEVAQLISADPKLNHFYTIDPAWVIETAYAKLLQNSPKPAPTTKKKVEVKAVSDQEKANAKTTSGKRSTPKRTAGERTEADWESMSEEDMLKDPVIGLKEN